MIKKQNEVFPSIKQAIYLTLLCVLSTAVISVIAMIVLHADILNSSLFGLCRTLGVASITLLVVYLMKKNDEKIVFFLRKSGDIEIYIDLV